MEEHYYDECFEVSALRRALGLPEIVVKEINCRRWKELDRGESYRCTNTLKTQMILNRPRQFYCRWCRYDLDSTSPFAI